MAEASKTLKMSVSSEKLWACICDYESYPKFVENVETVRIKSRKKDSHVVEYQVKLLGKEILYTLNHKEKVSKNGIFFMDWTLVESKIFKENSGSWSIQALSEGECEATYSLRLDFNIYVPGMILNGLVKSTLPKMMESFEAQAQKRKKHEK